MKEFGSVEDILDLAIVKEQEAHDFYVHIAGKMDDPAMKKAFVDFSKEELGHKRKLQAVRAGEFLLAPKMSIPDLKIGDYLVDAEPDENMTYQDALILAMKNEKVFYRLYTDLAGIASDETLRSIFASLAQEEAKHKLRFEIEYDDMYLTEN